jgi:hypothetical protein
MRAAKMLAVLAIAALGIGSFSAVAAGKTYKGQVAKPGFCDPEIPSKPRWGGCGSHGQKNPTFDKSGLVSAEGSLEGAGGCIQNHRSMRLQLLNKNGVVLRTLDRSKADGSGFWTLSGKLPRRLPAGTNYVRVKAKEQTVGRELCLAGFSRKVAIPARAR